MRVYPLPVLVIVFAIVFCAVWSQIISELGNIEDNSNSSLSFKILAHTAALKQDVLVFEPPPNQTF